MSKNNCRVSSVSYEAIKLEAAELEIEPGVYLNATGTAEKAPYLLRVIPKEKIELDAFCQAVAKLTGHTFEETRRENDIRMEVLAAAAAEGYTYIDTGYVTFELRIAGSIGSTTAAPTREANPVYLAAYPSRDLAASLAAITAKLSKAAAPFKIDTVWGKDSHDRFVTSGGVFQVNGTGFDSPAVMLAFADGAKSPAEVESWKPTYIRATAPEGEDAKTVTLEVTCETKDGAEVTIEKPNVPFKFVTLPPEPIAGTPDGQVKVLKATDGGQSATFTFGHDWKVEGVNMFSSPHEGVDWTLSEVGLSLGTAGFFILDGVYAPDGTLLTVKSDEPTETPEPGTYPDATLCIMAQKADEEEPYGLDIPIKLVVNG